MTSKIKVDNINKVSDDSNIIKKCGSTTTVGSGSGQTIVVDGATVTLGRCGGAVNIASGATTSGMGRTGTVNWCTTAKTSPLTVVSGNGYFINTAAGAITVTLPSSPSAGDIVAFKDYAGTWASNNVTVGRGGSKIGGVCSCATLNTTAQSVTLIYVDGTKGWLDVNDSEANVSGSSFVAATGGTVLTVGDFKTHIFTSSGCFQVTCAGNAEGSNKLDYFVVAGGGGGGGGRAGGGGAGGFRLGNAYSIPAPTMSPLADPAGLTAAAGTFPITIGAGSPGGSGPGTPARWGARGNPSTFSTITSTGGGGGGADNNPPGPAGADGGSGGGAGCSSAGPGAGGLGNTPPVSPPQGNPGGYGAAAAPVPYPPGTPTPHAGGGGGGAGATGGNRADSPGANGGPGGIGSFVADPYFGPTAPSYGTPGPVSSVRYFAGGGGGAGCTGSNPGTVIPGGAGGGGTGDESIPGVTAGTANTGGGGGGRGHYSPSPGSNPNGSGGSGFIAIRYKFQ